MVLKFHRDMRNSKSLPVRLPIDSHGTASLPPVIDHLDCLGPEGTYHVPVLTQRLEIKTTEKAQVSTRSVPASLLHITLFHPSRALVEVGKLKLKGQVPCLGSHSPRFPDSVSPALSTPAWRPAVRSRGAGGGQPHAVHHPQVSAGLGHRSLTLLLAILTSPIMTCS